MTDRLADRAVDQRTASAPAPAWPPPSVGASAAIAMRGLRKSYGAKLAVDGIDLDVPRGCFFGLVGPNGAGKTTMIRMLTGLLRPDDGRVWVDGVDLWADPIAAKARIGVLPDEFRLFDRLSGAELIEYCGLLRAMPPGVVADRSAELLDVLGLTDAADTLVIDYSTGMRKKVALACALLHSPTVLFLDEPFEAIDPVSTRTLRAVLERFTAAGNTVMFSSHVMEVVERLCDRVGVVNHGRLIAEGPIDVLRSGRRLEDVFVDLVGEQRTGGDALGWLGGRDGRDGRETLDTRHRLDTLDRLDDLDAPEPDPVPRSARRPPRPGADGLAPPPRPSQSRPPSPPPPA